MRSVRIGHFENPAVPVGQKRAGYQIVIDWRAHVLCRREEIQRVEQPTVTSWSDLEDILEEVLGESWEKKIKRVE